MKEKINKISREDIDLWLEGCANKCSKCKKTGHHGSIPLYVCESGNEYLICGWCGYIEKVR